MTNIIYRISATEKNTETKIKGQPLTIYEIDGNMKALVDAIETRASKDSPTFNGTVKFDTTGAVVMPFGTTDERPQTPEVGMFRINTTYGNFEYYNMGSWSSIVAGATGAKNDQVFYLNDQVVNNSYEIPSGKNAMTTGKITVADGVKVTVPSNSRWAII